MASPLQGLSSYYYCGLVSGIAVALGLTSKRLVLWLFFHVSRHDTIHLYRALSTPFCFLLWTAKSNFKDKGYDS